MRGDAALTLHVLAEALHPEITDHADAALPVVLEHTADHSPSVVRRACWALDTFTERLGAPRSPTCSR